MKKKPADIENIEIRIKQLKDKEKNIRKEKEESEYSYAAKTGFRVGTELLSGVVIGAAIGYFLDMYLETKPWLLILFLFLGAAAGFLNVYRFVKNENDKGSKV